MEEIFYLDDYNLICSNLNENLLSGNIALFKNDKQIDFDLYTKDNLLCLSFFDEYNYGDKLFVLHNDNKYEVINRFIVQSNKFDKDYLPELESLGAFYNKKETIFKTWIPLADNVTLVLDNKEYVMKYTDKGVYEIKVKGNYLYSRYHYQILRNNELVNTRDIFSYVNSDDNNDSIVIDINKYNFKNIETSKINDPIIYELSIRDFSSDNNVKFKYPKKFKALLEDKLTIDSNSIGVDYLANLGISHLQLLPVLNYDLDNSEYNWGYNPVDFNTFYLGYVTGKEIDSSIIEFREMIDYLHSRNLKVNLDVVFNHVYQASSHPFNQILPYYFFRYNKDGSLADGSYCGNEIRSEGLFVREYLKVILKRLVTLYDVDGFRFDLMGLIDLETINYLYREISALKKDIMMYGEGWNMGNSLIDSKKAIISNASLMNNIAFFNGYYRDSIRGPFNEKYTKGYIAGNKEYQYDYLDGLCGSNNRNLNPIQSINYAECHDNSTFFDRVSNYDIDNSIVYCKMALASVLLSRGIPFIHMGQEFLREKNNIDNSYNAGDEINKIDWSLVIKNKSIIEYCKQLIKIRRSLIDYKDREYNLTNYYELPILNIEPIDIIINNTEYDYIYDSWITYKDIYLLDNSVLHDLKCFKVNAKSIVVAIKS